ncbi:uncharacterized protein [Apostichopus japonicus]|uniref:uncharacterized protein isoform X2 n=1 Tax=Stichopus japonicus TaxID=307972 RepID=UPI003AB3DBC9
MDTLRNSETIIYFMLFLVSYSVGTQKMARTSENVSMDCSEKDSYKIRWEYNHKVIFSLGLNVGHRWDNEVYLSSNGTLIIQNLNLDHEGNYSCYEKSTLVRSYILDIQVTPTMYITSNSRNASKEILTDGTKENSLTCHAKGAKPRVHLSWFQGGSPIADLEETIVEDQHDNRTFSTSLIVIFPEFHGSKNMTCMTTDFMFGNMFTSVILTHIGQIILTVNGRIVQSMFSTGIDEEIFVECRLNDSSANITWTWMQYDGKANSTISKDVYSTHSSTVLKMIFSANETILSCSANSTGSAGSVILSRDIVIRLKDKTGSVLTWTIKVLMTVSFIIGSCLLIAVCCRRKRGYQEEVPRSIDIPMNEDLMSEDPMQLYLPGPSRDIDQPDDASDKLKNITLTSRLSSSGQIEYWLATTENARNSTVIAKFMSETATISQLLTFRALAKNLLLLTNHDNVVQLLHTEVNEVQCYMYCEYTGATNLRSYLLNLHPESTTFNIVPQLIRFAENVADAMEFLHNNKFSHPALCSRKVLITDKGVCKVYDIWQNELASQRVAIILTKENVPSAWLAPETLLFGQYSGKSDVWSFGVLLWEVFSYGEIPYRYCNKDEIETFVKHSNNLLQPTACPGGILMLSSWEITDSKRPTFECIRETICDIMTHSDQSYCDSAFDDAFHSSYNCLYHDVTETDR